MVSVENKVNKSPLSKTPAIRAFRSTHAHFR